MEDNHSLQCALAQLIFSREFDAIDELSFLDEAGSLHDAVEGLILLGDSEDHQTRTNGQLIQHLFSFFLSQEKDFRVVEIIEILGH